MSPAIYKHPNWHVGDADADAKVQHTHTQKQKQKQSSTAADTQCITRTDTLGTKHNNKDILLFDLNGTLCARSDRNKVISLRPNILELKRLKRKYRIGVYTSVTRYNAFIICDTIEDVCGRLFDRSLIFTREHTFPFTPAELKEYNYAPYKTKKSLCKLFPTDTIKAKRVRIIDDEICRVLEKDQVISVSGWYGDRSDDMALKLLVDELLK